MIDQQFREPDPIKDNLFAELIVDVKCNVDDGGGDNGDPGHGNDGQILNKIEFQRLSDYTITTKRRRPFRRGANETTQNLSSLASTDDNNEVSRNRALKTMATKNNSNDAAAAVAVVNGPMKASLQLYLHIFSEAIEW